MALLGKAKAAAKVAAKKAAVSVPQLPERKGWLSGDATKRAEQLKKYTPDEVIKLDDKTREEYATLTGNVTVLPIRAGKPGALKTTGRTMDAGIDLATAVRPDAVKVEVNEDLTLPKKPLPARVPKPKVDLTASLPKVDKSLKVTLPKPTPKPAPARIPMAPPVQEQPQTMAQKFSKAVDVVTDIPIGGLKQVARNVGEQASAVLPGGYFDMMAEARENKDRMVLQLQERYMNEKDPAKKQRFSELILQAEKNFADNFNIERDLPNASRTGLQQLGDIGSGVLDIATLGVGGAAVRGGITAIKGARTLAGAKAAAGALGIGTAYGATGALQSGETDIKEVAKQTAKSAVNPINLAFGVIGFAGGYFGGKAAQLEKSMKEIAGTRDGRAIQKTLTKMQSFAPEVSKIIDDPRAIKKLAKANTDKEALDIISAAVQRRVKVKFDPNITDEKLRQEYGAIALNNENIDDILTDPRFNPAQKNVKLQRLFSDPMVDNFYNQTYYKDAVSDEMKKSKGNVVFIDVANMSAANNSQERGYAAIDELLSSLGKKFDPKQFGEGVRGIRTGGDEIALIGLPKPQLKKIKKLVKEWNDAQIPFIGEHKNTGKVGPLTNHLRVSFSEEGIDAAGKQMGDIKKRTDGVVSAGLDEDLTYTPKSATLDANEPIKATNKVDGRQDLGGIPESAKVGQTGNVQRPEAPKPTPKASGAGKTTKTAPAGREPYQQWLRKNKQAIKEAQELSEKAKTIPNKKNRESFLKTEKAKFDSKYTKQYTETTKPAIESKTEQLQMEFKKPKKPLPPKVDKQKQVIKGLKKEIREERKPFIPKTKKNEKASTLGLKVQTKNIEQKLTDVFSDEQTYGSVNVKNQAKRAADLISKDIEKAKRIALGKERPPAGVLPESVFVAIENHARETGDIKLLHSLASQSRLVTEASEMGQRIRMLAERDPNSEVAIMQDIIGKRNAAIEKSLGVDLREGIKREVSSLKQTVKNSAPKVKDWSSFIDSIKC